MVNIQWLEMVGHGAYMMGCPVWTQLDQIRSDDDDGFLKPERFCQATLES